MTAAQRTESQASSAIASCTAALNAAGGDCAGSTTAGFSTSRPAAAALVVSCAASVVELAMTRTRSPDGSGWRAAILAMSNIALRRWVTMIPAWRNSASTASSGACPSPPRTPRWSERWVRPGANATTGLRRARRRLIRENLRGLPIESSDIRQTRVSSSSCQYCRTSFAVTSA